MSQRVNRSSKPKKHSENKKVTFIRHETKVIYSSPSGKTTKNSFDGLTSVCCKKLGWDSNSRERQIKLGDSLFSTKFFLEKRPEKMILRVG